MQSVVEESIIIICCPVIQVIQTFPEISLGAMVGEESLAERVMLDNGPREGSRVGDGGIETCSTV